LVNAADNKIRDPTMDHIKVTVDRENGSISIFNNGRGIPIEIHEVATPLQFQHVERENLHP
jgi:DNA topoisomerase II